MPENEESPQEVVATAVPNSSAIEDLENTHSIEIRNMADIYSLHRQLLEEQKTVMAEIRSQREENHKLNESLLSKNQELQAKLELISKVEVEARHKPGEQVVRKIKKPFSSLGY